MKITKVSSPAHVTALSQQFRFSDDALRALDTISQRIKELIQRQKTIEKQLASVTSSLFLEVKLGDGPTNSPEDQRQAGSRRRPTCGGAAAQL